MKKAFLLSLEDSWRLVRLDGPVPEVRDVCADDDAAAGAVKSALQSWGWRGQAVCLGLPSRMVYAAQIETENLPRKQRQQAMLYRLEEQLPMDIESLVVDFLPASMGRAMGVGVNAMQVRSILDRLAEAGIEVAAIGASALMTLWSACQAREETDYVLVVEGGRLDLFRMQQKQVLAWYSLDGVEDLVRAVRADQLVRPIAPRQGTARLVGEATPALHALLEKELGLRILMHPAGHPLAEAGRSALRMLAGQEAGWINFRQGGLARGGAGLSGASRAATAMAMLLLILLTGVFHYRAWKYDQAGRQYLREQQQVYARLYPGSRPPTTVAKRLQSELRRLSGVLGSAQDMPARVNVLDVLRQVVRGLPQGVRVRIHDVRIDQGTLMIEGQVRAHSDAEAIQRGLAQAGITLEPPRTERLASGVGFTLTGQIDPAQFVRQRGATTQPGDEDDELAGEMEGEALPLPVPPPPVVPPEANLEGDLQKQLKGLNLPPEVAKAMKARTATRPATQPATAPATAPPPEGVPLPPRVPGSPARSLEERRKALLGGPRSGAARTTPRTGMPGDPSRAASPPPPPPTAPATPAPPARPPAAATQPAPAPAAPPPPAVDPAPPSEPPADPPPADEVPPPEDPADPMQDTEVQP